MAIKDIFKMIKADRYTQDGREELIKAQEAITEDITYKPGDISRKTGLQKQPDGSWAPVKNAPAQKKGLGGKTLTKGAKHFPTVGEYAENGPIEQRMAMKKLLQKNDTESGSGVPIRGSNWMSLPSGTRMTFEGAKEKMAQNSQRIEALKKSMEGKSFADNFRAGIELKKLENENEYIAERLPPEMREESKTETPSASSDWKSDLISKLDTEKLKQMDNDFKEFEKSGRNVSPEAKERNDLVKSELAKRGETVTKMSDLVAQKSRPESAPTGRQPTPEMLERDKMRHSPEFQARRDKLDAEHPRTETGAPSAPKHTLEVGSEVKFKRSGQPITIKEIENYGGTPVVVGEYDHNGKKETNRFRLDELEYEEEEKKPTGENKIAEGNTVKFKRTGQPIKIKKVENYGGTPVIVGEYEHNGKTEENRFRMDEISTDSAPRVLTGDCKVRIKKSK